MKKVLIGVVAVTALLGAVVAYAVSSTPLGTCGDSADCKGKIETTWWNSHLQACYSVKISCKGHFTGINWSASLSGPYGGPATSMTLGTTSGPPNCNASTSDPGGVNGLKVDCDADSEKTCNTKATSTKAKGSIKERPDLCPVTCVKPDKVLGCGP